MTVITPTYRPKSDRNRCVIEVFGGIFYVVTLLFGFFCEWRGFCRRIESNLFLFLFFYSLTRQCFLDFSMGVELRQISSFFSLTVFEVKSLSLLKYCFNRDSTNGICSSDFSTRKRKRSDSVLLEFVARV